MKKDGLLAVKRTTVTATTLVRKTAALLLASSFFMVSSGMPTQAQILDTSAKPVRGQVAISRDVNIAPGSDKVSLNMRDASLRDVLNMLAQQGKFNLIMDDSVDGTLTVDIKNISINKALEYVFTVADLSYTKDGNTVIVASKDSADEKNLNAKTFKAIPVLYKDATMIANQLNSTLFKISRPGGSSTAIAASDPDSNSLLIIGTDSDLKLVADALRELDVPRNRKVYNIRHNRPSYVAQVLAANFFTSNNNNGNGGATNGNNNGATNNNNNSGSNNNSTNSTNTSGGGGTTGNTTTGGSNNSTTTGGGSTANGGGTSGGGTNGSNGTGGLSTFTTGGVTFISEPIASTLTVLGTEEQLALIDSLIDQVDVRRPQAVIEVSLVELQNTDRRSLKPTLGTLNLGREVQLTLNNNGLSTFLFNHINNNYSNTTTAGANPSGIKQNNILSNFSLTNTNGNTKNRVLANPTIVAMDGTSSTINITDQIPTITQTVTTTATGPVTATSISTQEAGVTLTLTPQINNDGSIILTLSPEVSQPAGTVDTGSASTTLISKRSMNIGAVRVQDGETLVIGGLIREGERVDMSKVPGLDKLPIVSAMFRSINNHDKDKTELVLMVTPHILKEDAVTYFQNASSGKFNSPNQGQGGIQPVSLPKFIGPMEMMPQNGQAPSPAVSPMVPIAPAALPASGASDDAAQKTAIPGKNSTALELSKRLRSAKVELIPSAKAVVKAGSLDALKMPRKGKAAPGVSLAPEQDQSASSRQTRLEIMDEIVKD